MADSRAAVEPAEPFSKDGGELSIFLSFEEAFVYIPAGTFHMGSPDHEPGRKSDERLFEVTLTERFFIQVTPVTQGQWKAVMGSNPSHFSEGGDDLPVEGVTWFQVQDFIKKLNSQGDGVYRLPTEAEWECACRAGSASAFADGDITELFCNLDPNLDSMGWYCGNSGRKSRPVGRKNPNAWGLYDMHGNVSEWCQDWYGEYPAEPKENPRGPSSGTGRIVRGGSWFSNAKNCRSACRFYWPPNSNADFIGFRLVREIR